MDLFNSKMSFKKEEEQYFDKCIRYNLNNNNNQIIIDLPSSFDFENQKKIDIVIRDGLKTKGDVLNFEDIDYDNAILKKYKYVLYGTIFHIDNENVTISCGGLIVFVSGKIPNIKQFFKKQNVFILIN